MPQLHRGVQPDAPDQSEDQGSLISSTQAHFCQKGDNLFLTAIKDGSEKLAAFFISKPEADLNFRDKGGKTALMYACEMGNHSLVGLLLKRNADPNIIDKVIPSPFGSETPRSKGKRR